MDMQSIKPDLMVHAKGQGSMKGANGVHVGTVDHLEGKDWIKLTKADSPDGKHRWFPVSWVDHSDDKAVYLTKTEEQFKAEVTNESPVTKH